MEPYDRQLGRLPLVMHCGHTFCKPCLKLVESRASQKAAKPCLLPTVECPQCRLPTEKQVEQVPLNFSILHQIEVGMGGCERHLSV